MTWFKRPFVRFKSYLSSLPQLTVARRQASAINSGWNRMARGGTWCHFRPFLVLLIKMIRPHFKRSPWPLGILPIGLCFNGNCFNYYNYYYQRHRTGSRIHYNTDKRISTKVNNRRFGTQQYIYAAYMEIWVEYAALIVSFGIILP